jgi:D-aspartate ligase
MPAALSELLAGQHESVDGASRRTNVGALVIGGDHPGLAVARSLGSRGIPVYILEDQHSISKYSKYVTKVIRVPDLLDEKRVVDSTLEVGERYDLRDWVLIPTRDETVAAFSLSRDRLAKFYRVTTPPWETTRWAWDKSNTYQLAEELGIPVPRTWHVRDASELPSLYQYLPLAIKPAVKEKFFYATGDKAWRADTPEMLQALYTRAAKDIPSSEVLIQEIIPGDGTQQLSYCAFFKDGKAHSTLLARRMRQHPREFGRAATYVETIENPEIAELSERFLRAIDFNGIVEVEYKRDPRDGRNKLLDVNARAWGFHGLGHAVGVDFSYLLFADQLGLPIEPCSAPAGKGWMRLLPDLSVIAFDLFDGYLKPRDYWQSIKNTATESVFSWHDPLPSLAEFALLPYIIHKKYRKRGVSQ